MCMEIGVTGLLTWRHGTKTLSYRPDGRGMGGSAALAATSEQARTSPRSRPWTGHQRLALHGSKRMRLAQPATRFSAVAHRAVLLPEVVPKRRLGTHPRAIAPAGASSPGTPAHPQCGQHRQPIGQDHGKRGPRGYDAGKKVKGRKRHILVDTQGLLLKAVVQPADMQDRDGGRLLVESLKLEDWPRLKKLWADAGYRGSFEHWVSDHTGWSVEIVEKPLGGGFQVLPRRWVVERTFAWLGKFRRLSKDYEALPQSEETWIYLA